MSVAENLRISVMGRHHHRFTLFRPVDRLARVAAEVDEYLEKLRLTRRRDDPAGDLAYSEQRTLEIGMALATDPEILLLDEPTGGMSREESAYTVALIRTVTEGKTLLVVEHDMNVVFTLCDQISVLVYGEIIASGRPRRCAPTARSSRPTWARRSRERAARGRGPARPLRQEPHPARGAPHHRGGRDRQPARAQRLRPLHHAEGDHGAGAAERRARCASTASTSPACGRSGSPAPASPTCPRSARSSPT